MIARVSTALAYDRMDDDGLVALARSRDSQAFREIMTRHNRRLYRVARGVLGDDADAEDVVQDAYLNAFKSLDSFRGDASLATWLTRIALNEALGRKRRRRPTVDIANLDALTEEARVMIFPGVQATPNPESEASRAETRRLLEQAVDHLPEPFRIVFVLREIEQMSVEETASPLELRPETVKTRLHRARRLLREALMERMGVVMQDTYGFDGSRCERMTTGVLARLGEAVE